VQFLGDIAVPVFFVLSGFVIRYITLARSQTLRQFLIDRAARIYSIVLPAMALTLLLAAVTSRVAPVYFQQEFAATCNHPFARIALNLTFLSQSWSHNTIPFIDSPFWSLSYEVLFYIAYGFAFYLRGFTRILALTVWALLAGPQVLFLLPIWLLGALVYDLHLGVRRSPAAAIILRLAACYLIIAGVIAASINPTRLKRFPVLINSVGNPLTLLHIPPMRATLFAFATGILAAIALLLLVTLADSITILRQSTIHPWLGRFRRIADGTFAIYLMHYPLMVLATATGLLRPHALALNLTTAAAICILLVAIAAPLDRFKCRIRSTLLNITPVSSRFKARKGASTQPAPPHNIGELPVS
jgi:peptidoglycan/LPS O-acetylase OafA/YrhL